MGRLLEKYLKPIYYFSDKEIESGYVGTEITSVFSHEFKGNIQPAESKITAEIYGKKVYDMVSVMCEKSNKIKIGGKFSLTNRSSKPNYKIVSLKSYSDHLNILAERID